MSGRRPGTANPDYPTIGMFAFIIAGCVTWVVRAGLAWGWPATLVVTGVAFVGTFALLTTFALEAGGRPRR